MNRRGITGIDVIVALSVLVIAAGAMLPIVAGGRRQARILTCAGNLESIGHGMEGYLEAHGGRYPTGTLPGGQELAWSNLLGIAGRSQWPNAVTMTPASDRPLNRYLSDSLPVIARVAHCPMDAGDSLQAQERTLFEAVGCSYVYPYRSAADEARGVKVVAGGIWAIQGHRRSEIGRPDRKLIMADTVIMPNRSAAEPYNQWHNAREELEANVLFADGHVANLPRKTGAEIELTAPSPAANSDRFGHLEMSSLYY